MKPLVLHQCQNPQVACSILTTQVTVRGLSEDTTGLGSSETIPAPGSKGNGL
jgi:hypothetical protein